MRGRSMQTPQFSCILYKAGASCIFSIFVVTAVEAFTSLARGDRRNRQGLTWGL